MDKMGQKINICKHCVRATTCLLSHSLSEPILNLQFPAKLLKRGEHLSYQGQPSENLYILRAGMLKSYFIKPNGNDYIMGFYLPPDLFGFEGIAETQHNIGIVALTQATLCVIPLHHLATLAQQSPALNLQLMRMVSRRIHQDNITLLRSSAKQRVAAFLLQLAARHEQLGLSGFILTLWMTHQDIANYLRITANTISRIFHEWHNKKIIVLEKNKIQLCDVDEIRIMAEC